MRGILTLNGYLELYLQHNKLHAKERLQFLVVFEWHFKKYLSIEISIEMMAI